MPHVSKQRVSYLIRAWPIDVEADGSVRMRFLVERIDDPPQRQAFDSFAAMTAYLHAQLVGTDEDHTPPDNAPAVEQ